MPVASASTDHRVALVLGAGGMVGVSYLVGALAALEEVVGLDADDADLIVGTSAGSVVGALLRGGVSASQLYRFARGEAEPPDPTWSDDGADAAFRLAFADPISGGRRAVGSAYTLARSMGIIPPILGAPASVRAIFPSGLFTLEEALQPIARMFPLRWPDRSLHICACDVERRERVVFGTPRAPTVPVATAVRASCAIPGFYESVHVGSRELVDGGVLSTSHLDLAAGHDLVIGIVPMSYDRHSARPSLHPYRLAMQIYRWYPSRSLRVEMLAVRDAGSRVVIIRPTVFEAQRHGFNLMNRSDRLKVAGKAYKTVVQSIATGRLGSALAEFGYRVGRRRTA